MELERKPSALRGLGGAEQATCGNLATETHPRTESEGTSQILSNVPSVDHRVLPGEVPDISNVRAVIAAIVMLLTYFLGAVSGQAVTLTIPSMAKDYGVSELQVQWVVSAYTLAYGCGLLFWGKLADVYGRKLCYIAGLLAFLIFNICSAVIKPLAGLFVARALAGLGLSMASPAGFGLISELVTREPARTMVFASFGLGGPLGAASGTILGGGIAGLPKSRAWSYLYYVLAAISIIPLIIGYRIFPGNLIPVGLKAPPLDWIGIFLATASVALFLFSLVSSGTANNGWRTAYVPALLATSVVLMVLFVVWERFLERGRKLRPAVNISLFTNHHYRFTFTLLCSFCMFFSASGWVYTATVWYQNLQGESALDNAVHLLPCNLLGVIAGIVALCLCSRVTAPILIGCSSAVTGFSSLIYAVSPPARTYWASGFLAQLFLPWGIDFTIGVGNVLTANLLKQDEQSVGGALFQMSYTVGSALGVALSSLVINERERTSGDLHAALQAAFWLNASMCWSVIVWILLGLRNVGIARNVGDESHSESHDTDISHTNR